MVGSNFEFVYSIFLSHYRFTMSWCQFHQHFMNSFFVYRWIMHSYSVLTVCVCNFLVNGKSRQKQLVKFCQNWLLITPCSTISFYSPKLWPFATLVWWTLLFFSFRKFINKIEFKKSNFDNRVKLGYNELKGTFPICSL